MTDTGQGAMNAKQTATYLGMSERWVWQSDLPRVRLGRRVKFLRVDVDAYVAARRTHGAPGVAA